MLEIFSDLTGKVSDSWGHNRWRFEGLPIAFGEHRFEMASGTFGQERWRIGERYDELKIDRISFLLHIFKHLSIMRRRILEVKSHQS
jgi:hypothetical protein